MKQNLTLIAIVAVLIVSIGGGYFFPSVAQAPQEVGSSTGTTFGTAKIATVVMAPATAAASSTSILNPDASDRKIESFVVDCSGVGSSLSYLAGLGIASWTVTFATSSTGAQVANTNGTTLNLSTSTVDLYNILGNATTTPALNRVWAAGSYLVPTFNATNTASCVVGVNYLAS